MPRRRSASLSLRTLAAGFGLQVLVAALIGVAVQQSSDPGQGELVVASPPTSPAPTPTNGTHHSSTETAAVPPSSVLAVAAAETSTSAGVETTGVTTSTAVSSAPGSGTTTGPTPNTAQAQAQAQAQVPSLDDHSAAGPAIQTGPAGPTAQEEADDLVVRTRAALSAFEDVEQARAAGYQSLTPAVTLPAGFVDHWIHPANVTSPTTLDPTAIESLVYVVTDGGGRTLIGAMYLLPFGATEADIPVYGQGVIRWHRHLDHCFAQIDGELKYVGPATRDGQCPAGGILVATPPMVHVWLIENICGPFSGHAYPTSTDMCDDVVVD